MRRAFLYILVLAAAPFLLFGAVRGSAALASSVLERRYPPPGRMIPVGDHRLQLYCMGSGSPTVVIEAGLGVDWVGWRLVIPQLAESYKVCVYDRAGYGWSEPGPMPRTALQSASELHALLTNAQTPGPYILAAHSFGGYIARIYASRFRDSLRAMVLVDPTHEDEPAPALAPPHLKTMRRILALVPPLGTDRVKRMYEGQKELPPWAKSLPQAFQYRYLIASSLTQLKSEQSELDSLPLSRDQARAALFPRDLPLTVITAMRQVPPELAAAHRELQGRLARSSDSGRQIVAENSGHMVSLEQPGLIVDAIRDFAKSAPH